MGCWLGWIVAALMLGYVLGGRLQQTETLRKRCARIAVYRGRRHVELMELLGGAAQEVKTRPGGLLLRTWRQGGYAITLCFDGDDVCLGVHEECG